MVRLDAVAMACSYAWPVGTTALEEDEDEDEERGKEEEKEEEESFFFVQ